MTNMSYEVNQLEVNQRKRTHIMMLRQTNKKANKKANKLATKSCPDIPFKYQPSQSRFHISKDGSAHIQDYSSKCRKAQRALFSKSNPVNDFGNIVKFLIAAFEEVLNEDKDMNFCELFGIEFVTV